MTMVYVLTDINTDEMISVHRTQAGAREAALQYLIGQCGYADEEWKEFADAAGYDSVESFQDAISTMDDYDDDMQISVTAVPLED